MKKPSLAQRARDAGLNPDTVSQRKRSGWLECDLLVPPLPINHNVNKARPSGSHHWRRNPAADTRRADMSALHLRKQAKRERAGG